VQVNSAIRRSALLPARHSKVLKFLRGERFAEEDDEPEDVWWINDASRPLIHAIGEAFIPDLGGCKIGDRPIDYHLNVLRQFGAVVEKRPGGIHISAPKGLQGAKISLPYPSVGATEQVLLSATR